MISENHYISTFFSAMSRGGNIAEKKDCAQQMWLLHNSEIILFSCWKSVARNLYDRKFQLIYFYATLGVVKLSLLKGGLVVQQAHGFCATWPFENVFNLLSLIVNRTKAKHRFFKYPCCLKPFSVRVCKKVRSFISYLIIFVFCG